MEISGIRSLDDLQAPVGGTSDPDDELSRTTFLELMIAQIENQDPLEPAKNEDFVAQLAQFSELEGIESLNQSMEELVTSMRQSTTIDAAVLVGRNVLVPTNQTALNTQGGIAGMITVPEPTDNLRVEILNDAGQVIHRSDYGAQRIGEFRFNWDGRNEAGEQVEQDFYTVRAVATTANGQVPFDVSLPDQVISVTIQDNGLIANLAGGGSVPAVQIKEIQ